MTHVSQKEVSEKWLRKIEELSVSLLAAPKSLRVRKTLVNELLTDTERIMLGKRIALIAMLNAGFSSYAIMKRLCISFSTFTRFAKMLDGGGYEHVLAEIKKLQEQEVFWENIEKFSRAGLPPLAGNVLRPSLLNKRKKP